MQTSEFPHFKKLFAEMCAAFDRPLKDDALDVYWKALRDVSFAEVDRNASRYILAATKDTKFPRPAELRDEPSPMASAHGAAIFENAAKYNAESWRWLREEDPVKFAIEYRIARASRQLVTLDEKHPARHEWELEDRRWAKLRFAPREEQERAVAAAGPIVP